MSCRICQRRGSTRHQRRRCRLYLGRRNKDAAAARQQRKLGRGGAWRVGQVVQREHNKHVVQHRHHTHDDRLGQHRRKLAIEELPDMLGGWVDRAECPQLPSYQCLDGVQKGNDQDLTPGRLCVNRLEQFCRIMAADACRACISSVFIHRQQSHESPDSGRADMCRCCITLITIR